MVIYALGRVTDSARNRVHNVDQCSRAVFGRSKKLNLKGRLWLCCGELWIRRWGLLCLLNLIDLPDRLWCFSCASFVPCTYLEWALFWIYCNYSFALYALGGISQPQHFWHFRLDSVCCRLFSSISGFHPLNASSSLPLSPCAVIKAVSPEWQNSPELRTTALRCWGCHCNVSLSMCSQHQGCLQCGLWTVTGPWTVAASPWEKYWNWEWEFRNFFCFSNLISCCLLYFIKILIRHL